MSFYEATFIARPDISESEVMRLTDGFSKVVTDNGGRLIKTEYWGLRNLAYLIKKSRKGHYVMLGIEAPYAAIQELERRMKLSEDILRNLTVKVEKVSTEPSSIMNSSGSEEESENLETRVEPEVEE